MEIVEKILKNTKSEKGKEKEDTKKDMETPVQANETSFLKTSAYDKEAELSLQLGTKI